MRAKEAPEVSEVPARNDKGQNPTTISTMNIEQLYDIYLSCGRKVATDSRTISGGELFFALKGENFDGNLYAAKALEAGAGYAVVSADSHIASSGNTSVIPVSDTLETLQALARHHRRTLGESDMTVIGLTGTNGKTTTKELIRAVLATKYRTAATAGNFNNDVGVPLTILGIAPDTRIAIVEMGANHPDDIERLVKVSEPDLGLITNVGKAHLLGFGSFDGVKKAKGQLYDWIAAHSGEIFLNTDDDNLCGMAAERPGLSILPYGLGCSGASVMETTVEEPFLRIRMGQRVIRTNLVGAYNAANVMAALAVGARFGVDISDAAAAVAAFVPANNRSQMTRTASNTLIIDAYNANPSSMGAALDNFAAIHAPQKIAMIGDMRELGADSLREHQAIVAKTRAADYLTIYVGEEFRKAIDATDLSSDTRTIEWFADSEQLACFIKEHPLSSATILIKGSRGIMMEKVIPEL